MDMDGYILTMDIIDADADDANVGGGIGFMFLIYTTSSSSSHKAVSVLHTSMHG